MPSAGNHFIPNITFNRVYHIYFSRVNLLHTLFNMDPGHLAEHPCKQSNKKAASWGIEGQNMADICNYVKSERCASLSPN